MKEENTLVLKKDEIKTDLISTFNQIHSGAFDIWLILRAESKNDKTVKITISKLALLSGFSDSKVICILRDLEKALALKRLDKSRGKAKKYEFIT